MRKRKRKKKTHVYMYKRVRSTCIYLSIHQCSKREVVKEICEVFPHVGIAVLSQTLVIEPVDLSDLSAFVVAPQDGYSVWKSNLHRQRDREIDRE